ncbi:amidohydrolase family protein [Chloroflexota bacterium]
MKIIAVEEHITTPELMTFSRAISGTVQLPDFLAQADERARVDDKAHIEKRLKEMDEAGIDMQVLSSGPDFQEGDASEATPLAMKLNDKIAEIIEEYPERFSGFAVIDPQDPVTAANELERAVKELGLKGTMIKSHVRGEYLDEQKYHVILERAEKLNVPIYLHPREPSPDMIKPYLTYPELTGAMWGFAADGGLHAMRLIFGGIFDKYPGLKIILGHMGEFIPFELWRIDNRWLKDPCAKRLKKTPGQYFKENFYVTTSGMFSQPVLQLCCEVLGPDRILFAVDFPHESDIEAVQFIESASINANDKEKIGHLNIERLLGL